MEDPKKGLIHLTEAHGYDDVLIYVPIPAVAELGNQVMAFDGCMSFFSGPSDHNFTAKINPLRLPLQFDPHYGNDRRHK